MLNVQTLAYDPAVGYDRTQVVGQIDFDPNAYKDRTAAAVAFYAALQKFAKDNGYNPDNVILNPSYHTGISQCVCWEEGPYQWGQYMTGSLHAHGWYTEPYYSFDVCFTE